MAGLPSGLRNDLRSALLRCAPVDTNADLHALFTDDRIQLWGSKLPQAESPGSRVDRLIDYLLDKRNAQGENALVLFLHVLADQISSSDICHAQFLQLANDLDLPLSTPETDESLPRLPTKCQSTFPSYLELDDFTGRQKLIEEIDAFLQEETSGYFILEAKAGLGKTTFLAYLVQERDYVCYFFGVRGYSGRNDIEAARYELACQLTQRWKAGKAFLEDVSKPEFFHNLLVETAWKRDQEAPSHKIVLVLDALDEIRTIKRPSRLELPITLPKGVYFIISQRPGEMFLHKDTARKVYKLKAEDPNNKNDMRSYLKGIITSSDRVRKALQNSSNTLEHLTNTLMAKSGGVWIYIYYMVKEIKGRKSLPEDLESLPSGLWKYYAQYWVNLRDHNQDTWNRRDLQLLATLAAAKRPLSLEQLCDFAGVIESVTSIKSLLESWQPFLIINSKDNLYSLYHASLQEFFSGNVDNEWKQQLLETEQIFLEELREATLKAHSDIADHYLRAWGGLEHNLTKLKSLNDPDVDTVYGLSHLAVHLQEAARETDLHALLRLEWDCDETGPYPHNHSKKSWFIRKKQEHNLNHCKNVWYTIKEAIGDTIGYLADVELAWQSAEDGLIIHNEISGEALGLQIRYALIIASLNSRAQTIPLGLLQELLKKGSWSPAQAFSYARRIPDTKQRLDTLVAILPYLPEDIQSEATSLIEEISNTIWEVSQIKVLLKIMAYLPKQSQHRVAQQALEVVNSNTSPLHRVEILSEFVLHLPESLKAQYLSKSYQSDILRQLLNALKAGEESNLYSHVRALMHVAAKLPMQERQPILQEIVTLIYTDDSEYAKAWGGAEVLPKIVGLGYPIHRALELAQELPEHNSYFGRYPRSDALAGLAPYIYTTTLSKTEKEALIEQFLEGIKVMQLSRGQLKALDSLAACSPEPMLRKIFKAFPNAKYLSEFAPYLANIGKRNKALNAITHWRAVNWTLKNKYEAIYETAYYLKGDEKRLKKLLKVALGIQRVEDRVKALTGLLPYLPHSWQEEILNEILALLMQLPERDWNDKNKRVTALAELAPYLPKQKLHQAVLEKVNIGDIQERAETLQELGENTSGSLQARIFRETFHTMCGIWDLLRQAYTLNELLPLLSTSLRHRAVQQLSYAVRRHKEYGIWYGYDPWSKLAFDVADKGYLLTALLIAFPYEIANTPSLWRVIAAWLKLYHPSSETTHNHIYQEEDQRIQSILEKIILWLVDHQFRKLVFMIIELIKDETQQVSLLTKSISRMPSTMREQIVRQWLDDMLPSWTLFPIDLSLPPLTTCLVRSQKYINSTKSEFVVEDMWNENTSVQVLIELIPHLPLSLHTRILEIAGLVKDERMRANLLSALIPYLPTPLISSMLEMTKTIEYDEYGLAELLVELIPRLSTTLLSKVLQMVKRFTRSSYQLRVLTTIAPHLPKHLYPNALEIIDKIKDKPTQVDAFLSLMAYIPTSLREEIFQKALEATYRVVKKETCVDKLKKLTDYCSEPVRAQVLGDALIQAQSIEDDRARADACINLLDCLSGLEWQKAIEEAISAAGKLPEENLHENSGIRSNRLKKLKTYLLELDHLSFAQVLKESCFLHSLATHTRKDVLLDIRILAPVIAKHGDLNAIEESFLAIQDVGRWWP